MTSTCSAAAPGLPVLFHDSQQASSRSLAAVVAAAAQPSAAQPDAELLALGATVDYLQGKIEPMLGDPDPQLDAAYEALSQPQNQAMKAMAALRATTLAGFAAQARALRYIHAEEFTQDSLELVGGGTDCRLAWAVLSGLADASPPSHGTADPSSATAIEHPAAELLDLGRRWIAVNRELADLERIARTLPNEDVDGPIEETGARISWLEQAINVLPATTPAGLAVKARILARTNDCGVVDDADVLAWAGKQARAQWSRDRAIGSLVRDLLRLAAQVAR